MSQRILFLTTHHSYFTRPIATALKQLSYKVKLFDYNRPNLDARLLGFTHNLFPKQTPSKVLENHINQSLLLQVKNYQPDILLAIKADSILPSTIKKINQMNVKTINWFPDWLISWGWIKKTAPVYSVFINSCQKAHQKCLKNKINSQYLPFAAQPDDPLQKLQNIPNHFYR